MKKRVWRTLFSVASLSLLFGVASVGAASFSDCSVTGIPGGGRSAVDFSHPNYKSSNSQGSRFKAEYISASLGINGQMVDSNAVDKSYQVGLRLNTTVSASSTNNPTKGNYYYAKGVTQGMEWSSNQAWSGTFSADPS